MMMYELYSKIKLLCVIIMDTETTKIKRRKEKKREQTITTDRGNKALNQWWQSKHNRSLWIGTFSNISMLNDLILTIIIFLFCRLIRFYICYFENYHTHTRTECVSCAFTPCTFPAHNSIKLFPLWNRNQQFRNVNSSLIGLTAFFFT